MERGGEPQEIGDFFGRKLRVREQIGGPPQAGGGVEGARGDTAVAAEGLAEMGDAQPDGGGDALCVERLGAILGKQAAGPLEPVAQAGGATGRAGGQLAEPGEKVQRERIRRIMTGAVLPGGEAMEAGKKLQDLGGIVRREHRPLGCEDTFRQGGGVGGTGALHPVFGPALGGGGREAVPHTGKEKENVSGAKRVRATGAGAFEHARTLGDKDDLKILKHPASFPVEMMIVGMAGGRIRRAGYDTSVTDGAELAAPDVVARGSGKVAEIVFHRGFGRGLSQESAAEEGWRGAGPLAS